MIPNEYLNEIALPTVRELFEATGDRRRAYQSCQAVFHLCDFIHKSDASPLTTVRTTIRDRCPFAFDIVDGIANGSKHCGRDRGAYRHAPGTEREAAAFTVDHSFLDHDRLETPGLEVTHDGRSALVDECVRDYLKGAAQAFPAHFSDIDLSFLD